MAVILTVEAQGFHSDIDPLMDFPFDAEARIVGGAAVVAALIRISPEIANARQRIGAPTAIQVQVVKDITVPPAPLHILAAAVLVQFHPVTHQPYRPLGGELITEPQANRGVVVQVAFLVKEKVTEAGGDIKSTGFFTGIRRPDQGQGGQ